ncbi:hypothetical protein B1B00_12220 [Bacillus sp. DSM 27956]|nr:hypothetical protein B1B00_12220 [Bacillus sp. DSM 27956]
MIMIYSTNRQAGWFISIGEKVFNNFLPPLQTIEGGLAFLFTYTVKHMLSKLIEAEGARLLRETLDSTKSGGGSPSPDKHKMNGPRRRFLPSWTI